MLTLEPRLGDVDFSAIWDVFHKELFSIGTTPVSLATILSCVFLLAFVVWGSRVVSKFLARRILVRTRLDVGLQHAISRITGYVALVVGFVVVLQTLGINLTSLTVIAGAIGVGIGFGLQNIINNFVSGLIILAERPIRLGDRIEVGGTAGRVIEIGARSTTIITNDNISLIVPNAEFISGRVTNWSHGTDTHVRFSVPVGVSYDCDPHEIERLLLEVARANPNVLPEPAPKVIFKQLGESTLDFELRLWSKSLFDHPGALKSQIYFAIWDSFKEHGIEIPFAQREINIKDSVRVEVVGRNVLRTRKPLAHAVKPEELDTATDGGIERPRRAGDSSSS